VNGNRLRVHPVAVDEAEAALERAIEQIDREPASLSRV
jgi:hypothetical protein